MTTATATAKCYVVPCVVCRTLYPAGRRDSRTCTPACRTALHRGAPDTYASVGERTADLFGGDPAHFAFVARLLDSVAFLLPERMGEVQSADDPFAICADLFDAWCVRCEELFA